MISHKKCNCPEDYWEEIVAKDDFYFPNKTVIYYHCDCCGEDFRIEDLETGEELFINDKSMTHLQKIQHLKNYLNQSNDFYSDNFKADILCYFDEDFTEENSKFQFLHELNSQEAIEQKVDFLLSQFVLKFDAEQETEDDFIYYYLGQ